MAAEQAGKYTRKQMTPEHLDRRWWRIPEWWKNPTDRFSFLLVVVTFLLFLATVGLFCATRDLVNDSKKTTELSSRAWLVPTGSYFFEPPVSEQSRVKISLENFGKIPALNARQIDEAPETRKIVRLPSGVPYIDSQNIDWPTRPLCSSKERDSEPIGFVYPSEKAQYLRHLSRGIAADLNLPDRSVIVIVRGCFLYNDSFGERSSPYCFYSVPAADKTIDVGSWAFAPCLRRTESPT
jgi:hypothetical protein